MINYTQKKLKEICHVLFFCFPLFFLHNDRKQGSAWIWEGAAGREMSKIFLESSLFVEEYSRSLTEITYLNFKIGDYIKIPDLLICKIKNELKNE